jgi:hypothetical protein
MKATIARSSPRYSTWIYIFGTDTIAVTGPPQQGERGEWRIPVDVTTLNTLQFRRIVIQFSKAWRKPADFVSKELLVRRHALISAEDVTVVEEAKLF